MLETVKNYAMQKYAGDEALVADFMEGFTKVADFSQEDGAKLTGVFSSGIAGAMGKGLGGMAVGLGIHGLNQAWSSVSHDTLHTSFLTSLEKAVASNVLLRDQKRDKVQQYAETIFKFAPHVACDPNLLSSVLAHVVQGEGVDVTIIKTLSDLEARFVENRGAMTFSPKTYV